MTKQLDLKDRPDCHHLHWVLANKGRFSNEIRYTNGRIGQRTTAHYDPMYGAVYTTCKDEQTLDDTLRNER